jgi:hypothetical protein
MNIGIDLNSLTIAYSKINVYYHQKVKFKRKNFFIMHFYYFNRIMF